jgi:hypothetical protein
LTILDYRRKDQPPLELPRNAGIFIQPGFFSQNPTVLGNAGGKVRTQLLTDVPTWEEAPISDVHPVAATRNWPDAAASTVFPPHRLALALCALASGFLFRSGLTHKTLLRGMSQEFLGMHIASGYGVEKETLRA